MCVCTCTRYRLLLTLIGVIIRAGVNRVDCGSSPDVPYKELGEITPAPLGKRERNNRID